MDKRSGSTFLNRFRKNMSVFELARRFRKYIGVFKCVLGDIAWWIHFV